MFELLRGWLRFLQPGFLPVLSAFAGSAGAGLLGSIASSAFGAHQAKKQMQFQDRMSSTSHQREVADLRAAGLNPILSATGGHGAATPGGAMATAPDMGHFVSTAAQAQAARAQTRLLDQQKWQTIVDTENKRQEGRWWLEHVARERAEKQLTQNLVPGSAIEAKIDSSAYGNLMRHINRALPTAGAVTKGVGLGVASSALKARELSVRSRRRR